MRAVQHLFLGLGVVFPVDAAFEVIGESFHCFSGSWIRILKRNSCSSSVIENQYLMRMMPERTSMRSNSGTEEEFFQFVLGAEAHDALDTGAVVPGAVEENHFAGARQMRHITLEIPLVTLALGRRRECHDAADARVEALRDTLDRAALAGGIAALEDHHDLELLVLDPVLKLHRSC